MKHRHNSRKRKALYIRQHQKMSHKMKQNLNAYLRAGFWSAAFQRTGMGAMTDQWDFRQFIRTMTSYFVLKHGKDNGLTKEEFDDFYDEAAKAVR